MDETAMTPGAVNRETASSDRLAVIPAMVGLAGAAVGLFGLPLFFIAASVPMSFLGVALGIRHRNELAMLFGAAGLVFAFVGFVLS